MSLGRSTLLSCMALVFLALPTVRSAPAAEFHDDFQGDLSRWRPSGEQTLVSWKTQEGKLNARFERESAGYGLLLPDQVQADAQGTRLEFDLTSHAKAAVSGLYYRGLALEIGTRRIVLGSIPPLIVPGVSPDLNHHVKADFLPTAGGGALVTLTVDDAPLFKDASVSAQFFTTNSVGLIGRLYSPAVHIDGGEATRSQNVRLRFTGDREESYQIAEGSSLRGSPWLPFAAASDFVLSTGDGTKTLYARFRDAAGTESDISTAVVVLDTQPPLNPSISIVEGPSTTLPDVHLKLLAAGAVSMKVGEVLSGVASIDYTTSLVRHLGDGYGLKTIYAVFRDAAGNETDPVAAEIVKFGDTPPPPVPQLVDLGPPGYYGQYRVRWTSPSPSNAQIYQLQEDTRVDFASALNFWPTGAFDDVRSHSPGRYYYRVRAWTKKPEEGGAGSNWSFVRSKDVIVKPRFRFQGTKSRVTQITDTVGRVVQLQYGSNGKVSRVIDPAQQKIVYTSDADGTLTSVSDRRGGVERYDVSPERNIERVTERNGGVFSYGYHYNDRMAQQTDPLGNTTYFHYAFNSTWVSDSKEAKYFYHVTSDGLLISTINRLEQEESFTYDADENVSSHTDRRGNRSEFTFDDRGNMLTRRDATGQAVAMTYDPSTNKVLSVTDEKGSTSTFQYDAAGNLTRATDRLGHFVSYAYDAHGQRLSATDALGKVTLFTYDASGNLVHVVDAIGNATEASYDELGRLTSRRDALGQTTRFEYDPNGNVIRTFNPPGKSVTRVFDPMNALISVTNELGTTTTMRRDALGNLVEMTDGQGNTESFVYECSHVLHENKSNLVARTDPNRRTTTRTYDVDNRLLSVTDPLGGIESYSYDAQANMTERRDPLGRATQVAYDPLNRVTRATYPDGTAETWTYDAVGNVTRLGLRDGRTVELSYDKEARLTGKSVPGLPALTYRYDPLGRLLEVSDGAGSVTRSYDAVGRVLQEVGAAGLPVTYAYDVVGRRTRLVYPDGDVVKYQYDALNRLSEMDDASDHLIAGFEYDDASRRKTLVNGNGTRVAYEYDRADRLSRLNSMGGSLGTTALTFSHDAAGNILRLEAVGISGIITPTEYTYDPAHRLVSASTPSATFRYDYDILGNRRIVGGGAEVSYVANALNQYTSVGGSTLRYDVNGNLVSFGERSFGYDARNRLTTATAPSVLATAGQQRTTVVATLSYDSLDRRSVKVVDGTATRFVYDGNRIIESLRATPGGEKVSKFVWGPDTDEALRMYYGGGPAGSLPQGWYTYHLDHLHSVREITSSTGALVERYDYGPFGAPTVRDRVGNVLTGSALSNTTLFTGREWDGELSLYHYRARAYEPSLGRFLQPDPVGYADGMNLYASRETTQSAG